MHIVRCKTKTIRKEEINLILYTKNICPKCMNVKFVLTNEGALDKVEFINLDEHPEIREELVTNPETSGLQGLPILKHPNGYTNDTTEILKIIMES